MDQAFTISLPQLLASGAHSIGFRTIVSWLSVVFWFGVWSRGVVYVDLTTTTAPGLGPRWEPTVPTLEARARTSWGTATKLSVTEDELAGTN